MFPPGSHLGMRMDRGRLVRARTGQSPTILSVDVSNVTLTSFTVTWTLSEGATGQIQYGTTVGLGSTTTKETSFTYTTHLQTVSGLTADTQYFFRVVGEDSDGNAYASSIISVTTLADTGSGITYDDAALPTSWTHLGVTYAIDHTGVNDSTPGINFWVMDQADGTDETHHKRLLFPATSILRMNTALTIGNKYHTTLWGHAPTSSAWIRGNATSYQDVGCRINVEWGSFSPHRSAFLTGARYNGYQNLTWSQPAEDIAIRGFDIRGNNPTPGIYPGGGYENQNALEYGLSKNVEFAYNLVRGLGGDLVRFRSGATGRVHHNYVLNTGRMGCTAVINYSADVLNTHANHIFEDNTIDRCGYWGIDLEPEDDSNVNLRRYDGLVVRNNLWGTFGSTSVGGGFAVIGGTANPTTRHIADVEVSGNTIDGYGYGSYAGNTRALWILVAHSTNLSTIPVGSDPRPQNVIIRDNVVTHGAAYSVSGYPSPLTARYTDGLVVTNNDANLASGDWTNLTGCTSVTESGNV